MRIRFSGAVALAGLLVLVVAWPRLGVRAQQSPEHYIELRWTAPSGGTPVAGYNVYRGTSAGGPYTKLNAAPVSAMTYNDTTGVGGTRYFYVVRSVDSAGVESVNSNEASAVMLGAPNPPTGLTAVAN